MLDNKGKAVLLGEPFGTASGKLRKMLLFKMAGQLNLLNCYRCGELIILLEHFSIEHKKAWSKALNPQESFYDIDNNIAFSHIKCNIGASNTDNKVYKTPSDKYHAAYLKMRVGSRYPKHLERKREKYKESTAQYPNLAEGLVSKTS